MICLPLFFFFMLLSLKDFVFFSSYVLIDTNTIFMNCIIFMVIYFIFDFKYNYESLKEKFSYYCSFFVVIFSVSFCFYATTPFIFLFFLEFTIYPMFYVICNLSKDYDKVSSALFMVFINFLGSLPFMIFSTSLFKGSFILFAQPYFYTYNFNFFLFFCFFLLFVAKVPIFLFHFWLTKAHVSASAAASMLLASLMLKLGTFGLIKFSFYFYPLSFYFSNIFFPFCLLCCIFFSFSMIRFIDLKHLVASSSISHMSLTIPMIFNCSTLANFSSVVIMVAHGIVSYALFNLVSLLYEVSHNRSFDFLKSHESLKKSFIFFFIIYMFLNLGFPPFLNFLSEMFFSTFFFYNSYIFLSFFSLSMVTSVIFLMYIVSKNSFSKKILVVDQDFPNSMNFKFFYCLVMIFFCLFMF